MRARHISLCTLAVAMLLIAGAMGGVPSVAASQTFGLGYQWHTFYGASDTIGELRGVATDSEGAVYLVGYSKTSWGTPLHAHSGGYDVIVLKLNRAGSYQWHTYYGASPTAAEDGDDEGNAIAIDGDNNLYLTGYSDRNWLGPNGTNPLVAHGADAEYMFVLKLNRSGAYQWHTFMQPGRARAIALDSSDLYLTGNAARAWGTPKHAAAGGLVVLKLTTSGVYQWHSYYGAGSGPEEERGNSIAIDAAHNLYVTGQAQDTWLGDGDSAPLNGFSGGAGYSSDIVVLKLASDGTYRWHTFYGASETDDIGVGIALDSDGNAYIAANSFMSWGSPLRAHSGEIDIALLKLTSAGAYQWHSFYGAGGHDTAGGIALNANGLYISGQSALSWLGEGGAAPAHPHSAGNNSDSVVLKVDGNGSYLRHTFYGASDGNDAAFAIALDQAGQIYLSGHAPTTWQGDSGSAPLHAHSGNNQGDGFVLKLSDKLYTISLPLVIR